MTLENPSAVWFGADETEPAEGAWLVFVAWSPKVASARKAYDEAIASARKAFVSKLEPISVGEWEKKFSRPAPKEEEAA